MPSHELIGRLIDSYNLTEVPYSGQIAAFLNANRETTLPVELLICLIPLKNVLVSVR